MTESKTNNQINQIKHKKLNFTPSVLLPLGRDARFHCCICEIFAHDGEGAHIISASDTGPRNYKSDEYYNKLPQKKMRIELNKKSNGMWLCRSCHKEIDKPINIPNYPVNKLKDLKKNHEDKCASDYDKIKITNDSFKKICEEVILNLEEYYEVKQKEKTKNRIKLNFAKFTEHIDINVDLLLKMLNKMLNIIHGYICNDPEMIEIYILFITNVCYNIRRKYPNHQKNERIISLFSENILEIKNIIGRIITKNYKNEDIIFKCMKLSSIIMAIGNEKLKNDMCELWLHLIKKFKKRFNNIKNIDMYYEYFMSAGFLFKKYNNLFLFESFNTKKLDIERICFGYFYSHENNVYNKDDNKNNFEDTQMYLDYIEIQKKINKINKLFSEQN